MNNARQIPFDKEAEMSVLGAIFLDPACYADVSRRLKKQDFYFASHQELYAVFGWCITASRLDLVTLKDRLEQRGKLEQVGGIAYIVEIANFVPSSSAVKHYAKIVIDCAMRRRMILGYEKAITGLYDRGCKIGRISDFVQSDILAESLKISKAKNISESGGEFLEELERRQRSGQKLPGLSTGYADIDTMTGGLEPGKLYILGGRPSMGKTALALNIATNIAKSGKSVRYFSLEMRNYEVMKRIVAAQTRIKAQRIKSANIRDDEYIRIAEAIGEFHPDSLYIDDAGYQTMETITSSCIAGNTLMAKDGNRIDCVIIDHLHLLSSSEKTTDRRLQIGEMSRAAKLLADRLKCPVVLLSQLSRAANIRKDNKPILSDLRESGDIEQDADVVMFVHREEYYKPTEENHGKAEIIFAKNRDGECGTLEYGWDKSITSFLPWEEYSSAGRCKGLPPLKVKKDKDGDEVTGKQYKMEGL